MLTQDELKSIFHYNPETGVFTWLIKPAKHLNIGKVAGNYDGDGYINITYKGKKLRAARLAWLYIHGISPTKNIDHINRIKTDNRICNLRTVTNSQNQMNIGLKKDNTSGYKGVTLCKITNKWRAMIRVNGKNKSLGYYDSIDVASKVYNKTAKELHGEFYFNDSQP